MHLMYTNQIIYRMCLEWMSVSCSAAKLAYTLKKEQLDAVVGFLSVYISSHWVWKITVLCLSHIEPHLLAPPKVVIIAFQQNKSAYRMAPDPSSYIHPCLVINSWIKFDQLSVQSEDQSHSRGIH